MSLILSSKLINFTKHCSPVYRSSIGRWIQFIHPSFGRSHHVLGCKSIHDSKNMDSNEEISKRIWTIPNGLCLFRIIVSPVVAYTIINNQPILSCAICIVAGLTDFADGYIARRYESQRSTLGGIIDPVADKILLTTLFLSTAISGQLPFSLASIVIGRDLLLIAGAAYKRYQLMVQPRTMSKFFNLRGLNMEVKSSTISKWNTAFQFYLIAITIASPLLNISDSILISSQYLVVATTIASGVDYIVHRDNYISPLKQN